MRLVSGGGFGENGSLLEEDDGVQSLTRQRDEDRALHALLVGADGRASEDAEALIRSSVERGRRIAVIPTSTLILS